MLYYNYKKQPPKPCSNDYYYYDYYFHCYYTYFDYYKAPKLSKLRGVSPPGVSWSLEIWAELGDQLHGARVLAVPGVI